MIESFEIATEQLVREVLYDVGETTKVIFWNVCVTPLAF
jgi:hypothetical protein